MKGKGARFEALKSLVRCEKDKRYANLEIDSVLKRGEMSEEDGALYTALVYSVYEKKLLLDYVLKDLVISPLEALDPEVLTSLRLGAAQMLFFDRIPDHSACDETVEALKATSKRGAAGLVNAVLRELTRKKSDILKKIGEAPLNVRYSVPEWMTDVWRESYGEEKTLAILEGFSRRSPLVLHANTLKIGSEELCQRFVSDGHSAHLHPLHPSLIVIEDPVSVKSLYGFDEGLFFVQGASSAIAVRALAPTPGARLLDACACPGGKSFAAAIAMEGKGSILSADLHRNKLSLVLDGAQRLGIDIITVEEHDARLPFNSEFDLIIADVPCSGLGVLSKKPDIREKKREEIERLPEIQASILASVARHAALGGRILYSTCTLNRRENEDVVNAFLEKEHGFSRAEGYPVTFFPGDVTEDGFYVDIIVRNEK